MVREVKCTQKKKFSEPNSSNRGKCDLSWTGRRIGHDKWYVN